tara:strand:- start:82 stop:1041 length:960 start_codon:yes stop_codon:yes gene_type:complete
MTSFDTTFDKNSLATIRDYSNQIYVLDYRDFYSNDEYLGDILSIPEVIKKNNSIYKVSFDKKINNNPSDKALKTSESLISKRKKIINDLKSKSENDLDAKQAYMIMNSFEERWLEADNISFDSNDHPLINIWGINPIHFPEFTPIEKPIENEPDDRPKDEENKAPIAPVLVIVLVFLTIVLLSFLQDCGNYDTALSNINTSSHYDNIVMVEGFVKDQKTNLTIAGASVILNKSSSADRRRKHNYSDLLSLKLISDRDGHIRHLNLPKGNYNVVVKKKYYYEKAIPNLNISGDKFNMSRYLILTKKPLFSRLIDIFKIEK